MRITEDRSCPVDPTPLTPWDVLPPRNITSLPLSPPLFTSPFMFQAAARRAAARQLLVRSRFNSTQAPHASSASKTWGQRSKTAAKYAGYFCLSTVVGVATVTAGILIHDVFTYNEKHVDRVPVSPLALNPEKGGPKNLPVVRVQVDDHEDEEARKLSTRPKLVIVGGGWGVRLHV